MTVEPALDVVTVPEGEDLGQSARATSWPVTLLASMALTTSLFVSLALPAVVAGPSPLELAMTAPFVVLALSAVRWTFDSRAVRSVGHVSPAVAAATVLPTLLGVGVAAGCPALMGVGVAPIGVLVSLATTPAVLGVAAALRAVEVRYLRASRRVFIVATPAQHSDVVREVVRDADIQLVGFLNLTTLTAISFDREQLARRIADTGATMLVLARQAIDDAGMVAAASVFNLHGGRVRDLGSFYERHFHKTPLSELTASWFLFDIAEIHRPHVYGFAKRALDVVISVIALVLTAPLLAVIAVAIRVTSRGPVLYRQERLGKNEVPFTLVKFRTMTVVDGAARASWAGAEAHRVTGFGRFLRRYRLDELPQLWTILRGDMSLVGPRPEQVPLVAELKQSIEFYAARHTVRPGLTGWAQINSDYGGSHAGTLEKLQYDLFYIRHQSLRLDMLIILHTARAVMRGHGSA
jgi:exopolysaccharide biosynthesis polyprenyl glycosylphosphotransferase